MKKIIAVLRPFDRKQNLYVFEDGNKIANTQTTLDDFNATIFKLHQEYDVDQIDLTGPKQFSRGLKHKLESAEIEKYSENNLIINII